MFGTYELEKQMKTMIELINKLEGSFGDGINFFIIVILIVSII